MRKRILRVVATLVPLVVLAIFVWFLADPVPFYLWRLRWFPSETVIAKLNVCEDDRPVGPLIEVLQDDDIAWWTRAAAAKALRYTSGERTTEALIATMKNLDEFPWVRVSAADTLKTMDAVPRPGTPDFASYLVVDDVDKCAFYGPRAVDALIAELEHKRTRKWPYAPHSVGEETRFEMKTERPIERAARRNYATVAGYSDTWIRADVPRVLGEIGDRRAVEPLIAALKDDDVMTRVEAASSLGRIGDVAAVEPLIGLLDDDDGFVRRTAATALGRLKDPRAVKPLLAALDRAKESLKTTEETATADKKVWPAREEAATFRKYIVGALGEIADPDAIDPLVAELERMNAAIDSAKPREPFLAACPPTQKDDTNYRGAIILAIREHDDPRASKTLLALLKRNDTFSTAARGLADRKAPEAVDPFLAVLEEPARVDKEARDRRSIAVWALGTIGDDRAIRPLISVLSSSDETAHTRTLAAEALGQFGNADALPALIAALSLSHSNGHLVRRSVKELRKYSDPRVVPALLTLLDNSKGNLEIQVDAATALAETGDAEATANVKTHLPAFLAGLLHTKPPLRTSLVRLMGKLRDPAGNAAIQGLLADPKEDFKTRLAAARALAETKNPACVAAVTAVLRDPFESRVIRGAMAFALAEGGLTKPLVEALNDRNTLGWVRMRIVEALEKKPDDLALKALRGALADANPLVSQTAAIVLDRLGIADAKQALPTDDETWVRDLAAKFQPTDDWLDDRQMRNKRKTAGQLLTLAMKDPHPVNRQLAAWLLGEWRDVDGLGWFFQFPDPHRGPWNIWDGSKAIDSLVEARDDEDVHVRVAVARALGEINGSGGAFFENKGEDPRVRRCAVWSMAQADDLYNVETLHAIANDELEDATVRAMAEKAFAQLRARREEVWKQPPSKDPLAVPKSPWGCD